MKVQRTFGARVGGDAQLARRLIQRAVSRRVGRRPVVLKHSRYHPRDVRRPSPTCVLSMGCATMLPSYALYSAPRLAFGKGRYARPPAGGCQSPAMTAPPKGEPRRGRCLHRPVVLKNRVIIGAGLPLPAGEVAMPSGIDGEGERRKCQPILSCRQQGPQR